MNANYGSHEPSAIEIFNLHRGMPSSWRETIDCLVYWWHLISWLQPKSLARLLPLALSDASSRFVSVDRTIGRIDALSCVSLWCASAYTLLSYPNGLHLLSASLVWLSPCLNFCSSLSDHFSSWVFYPAPIFFLFRYQRRELLVFGQRRLFFWHLHNPAWLIP